MDKLDRFHCPHVARLINAFALMAS
jgi:hypothetical protein